MDSIGWTEATAKGCASTGRASDAQTGLRACEATRRRMHHHRRVGSDPALSHKVIEGRVIRQNGNTFGRRADPPRTPSFALVVPHHRCQMPPGRYACRSGGLLAPARPASWTTTPAWVAATPQIDPTRADSREQPFRPVEFADHVGLANVSSHSLSEESGHIAHWNLPPTRQPSLTRQFASVSRLPRDSRPDSVLWTVR